MKQSGAVQSATRTKIFTKSHRIWRSLSLGIENGSLMKNLKLIEDDIFRLERLLEGGSRSAPATTKRQSRKIAKSWHVARESVSGLLDSLGRRLLCSCRANHTASLRLESRRDQDVNRQPLHFNVLFSFDKPTTQLYASPWRWCNVKVLSSQADNIR